MDKASRDISYVYKSEFRYVRVGMEIKARRPVVLCGIQPTLSWFYSFSQSIFFFPALPVITTQFIPFRYSSKLSLNRPSGISILLSRPDQTNPSRAKSDNPNSLVGLSSTIRLDLIFDQTSWSSPVFLRPFGTLVMCDW